MKTTINFELLYRLYYAYSPSGQEHAVQAIIRQELNRLKIPFTDHPEGHIYSINPGKPLLSAHMDQIAFGPVKNLAMGRNKNIRATNNTSLGADDKNGVFIALTLLSWYRDLSFCFSTNEESGGGLWLSDIGEETETNKVPFALIFDRRGNSDIIGVNNGYCTATFQSALNKIIGKYGYKPANGTFSDADYFKDYCNSVNLSCGYYGAHTRAEYSNLDDIKKAIQVGQETIINAEKLKFKKPDKSKFTKSSWKKYRPWAQDYGSRSVKVPACNYCGMDLAYYETKKVHGESVCDTCYSYYSDTPKTYKNLLSI